MHPVPSLDDALAVAARLTGRAVSSATPLTEGGYSPTVRAVVRWADGGTSFVKAEHPFSEGHGANVEHRVYSALSLPCLPRVEAYDEGPPRVLVTEDLSGARWGTPVTSGDCALLRDALDLLAPVAAPDGLVDVPFRGRWAGLRDDPAALVRTGLVSAEWVARHAGALADAEAGADPSGDRLVHLDMWLQNWCRLPGRGAVIVDWAGGSRGNPLLMRAWAEAGVRAAGGPPGVVLPPGHPEWAAWMAGQAACFLAGTDGTAYPRLLETERREALATLRWACDELGLPHPEPSAVFASLGPWRP